jgi:hypothetical protein
MGIEYKAAIIVGLPRDEIESEDEDVIESLDQCPPYYGGGDQAIIGVVVVSSPDYAAKEFAWDQAAVDAAMATFHKKTGQVGKLYLTPVGH